MKYILLVEIAPTVCPKTESSNRNCPLLQGAPTETCQIEFLEQPWISKTKSIIRNNCTSSQDYSPRSERENEIVPPAKSRNDQRGYVDERFSDSNSESNFDWLAELESQIQIDESVPSVKPLENKATAGTLGSEVRNYADDFFINNQETTTPFEETTVITTQLPLAAQISSEESEEDNNSQEAEEQKSVEATNKSASSSSEETKNDVDRRFARAAAENSSESQSQSAESVEVNKSRGSSEEETKTRQERSTTPLEKITPEEKPLVKHLADFAASTLDNIDDDNHKRIVLQILGAKKMKMQGTLYHLTMRIGVSRCAEEEYDESCKEKLFENLTKICKVQVHVNEDQYTQRVLKSQCQTIKKDNSDINRTTHNRFRRGLLGGREKIPTDDPVGETSNK